MSLLSHALKGLIQVSDHKIDFNNWRGDLQSRLYWSCLMLETILVQELEFPDTGLHDFENFVPLPRFTSFASTKENPRTKDEDTFFQFHFLAQVAHRIILTRVQRELFFCCKCSSEIRS